MNGLHLLEFVLIYGFICYLIALVLCAVITPYLVYKIIKWIKERKLK